MLRALGFGIVLHSASIVSKHCQQALPAGIASRHCQQACQQALPAGTASRHCQQALPAGVGSRQCQQPRTRVHEHAFSEPEPPNTPERVFRPVRRTCDQRTRVQRTRTRTHPNLRSGHAKLRVFCAYFARILQGQMNIRCFAKTHETEHMCFATTRN